MSDTTKTYYEISNTVSGASLGAYEGDDEAAAILASLQDAGAMDEVTTTVGVVAGEYGIPVPDHCEAADSIRIYDGDDGIHAAHPWDDDWAPADLAAWHGVLIAAAKAEGIVARELPARLPGHRPYADECKECGRLGWISDWPGNDPANTGTEVRVLCTDAHGHLVCDDCAD